MSRVSFLTSYIVIAIFFSGGLSSPWTISVMALALGQQGFSALLSPVFIIQFLAPIALIVLAHYRGRKIGMPKLIWFPIAACILQILPLLIGLLTTFVGFANKPSLELVGLSITMLVATTSTLGPLILHTVCCVIGGKNQANVVEPITKNSPILSTTKLIVAALTVLAFVFAAYYFLRPTHEKGVHWIEAAALHDGRSINVHRTYAQDNYYSLSATHPDTGNKIAWNGTKGFNPVLLEFFNGIPYLVILQNDIRANLKQYGCPEIPYVFFRFEQSNDTWKQISSSAYPSTLIRANLTAFFNGGYISEGTVFIQSDIDSRNAEDESVGTSGYFSISIPADFESWKAKHKNQYRVGHHHDGCRQTVPSNEDPNHPQSVGQPAQEVAIEIIETILYDPEWIVKGNAETQSRDWQAISWNNESDKKCRSLVKRVGDDSDTPELRGWLLFVNDPTGRKKARYSTSTFCDQGNLWFVDYGQDRRRVFITKFSIQGDFLYRLSFNKPDTPGGYLGGILQPTFRAEDGYLYFEWWNTEQSGWNRHIKRAMKVRVREPLTDSKISAPPNM